MVEAINNPKDEDAGMTSELHLTADERQRMRI